MTAAQDFLWFLSETFASGPGIGTIMMSCRSKSEGSCQDCRVSMLFHTVTAWLDGDAGASLGWHLWSLLEAHLELRCPFRLLHCELLHVRSLLAYAAVKKLAQLQGQAVVFRVVTRILLWLVQNVHQSTFCQEEFDQVLLLLFNKLDQEWLPVDVDMVDVGFPMINQSVCQFCIKRLGREYVHQDGPLLLVLLVYTRRIELNQCIKCLMIAVFGSEHDRCLSFAIAYGRLGLYLDIGKDCFQEFNLLSTYRQINRWSVLFNICATKEGFGARLKQSMHTLSVVA